jgi:hypothetical protein
MTCNALAPICGDRCTLPKGHEGEHHQKHAGGRLISGWYGDHSDDPQALESERRCSMWKRSPHAVPDKEK